MNNVSVGKMFTQGCPVSAKPYDHPIELCQSFRLRLKPPAIRFICTAGVKPNRIFQVTNRCTRASLKTGGDVGVERESSLENHGYCAAGRWVRKLLCIVIGRISILNTILYKTAGT